jgi:multicomponent Na+:H+ antiporter subunit D
MGMNALVMITGIFSVYVFIEVTAVASFILMAINRERRALEAAFKYLIISSVASLFMLFGIGMLFLISGDTTFAATAAALNSSGASGFAKFGVAIFVAGLLIKSGVIPFHGWLPDAYQAAPRSVSVFLAGIVTKISGVYVLMRLVYSVFGLSPRIQAVLMFFGAASIVLGAVAAIGQKDLKRMLAYSSVSQVGYIVLSVGCGTPIGILGAVFHFFNHAVFKSLLFVNAAALEEKLGTTDMSRMGGLGSKMPVTSFTSIVGFLSTGGIPPLSGFWSKLIIILALWTAGHYAYAVLAVVASALTLSYFVIMQKKIFFGKTKPELEGVTEPGMAVLIPEIALAAITIIVGLAFPLVMNNLMMPAANILR